jgi:WD40 repeat protein
MRTTPIASLLALAPLALLLACGTDSGELPSAPGPSISAHRSPAPWSPWSEPVNLGPLVNSTAREQGATLSPDGRSLYFQSNRPGGVGDNDLWVSHRGCHACPWEAPVNLGPVVNSSLNDGGPSLSDDGLLLFFSSARAGGQGLNDIYMSRRTDPQDDLSWGPPVPLGPDVNTPARETGPEYVGTRGGGLATLYFVRGPALAQDIYSVLVTRDGETRGPAVLSELSDPTANEIDLTVRKNGREVILGSDRGTPGNVDLWVATRRSVQDPWSQLEKLGPPLSTVAGEFQPSLSRDGRTLLFTSNRPGSLVRSDGVVSDDIWMATRTSGGGDEDDRDDPDDENEDEGVDPRHHADRDGPR